MSTAAPTRPAAERPAQRSAAAQPQTTGLRLDPIRVLRQNQWKIAIGAIVGAGLGVAANLLLSQFYPFYSGTVLFKLQPGIAGADQFVARDSPNDDIVERLGQTEAQSLLFRPTLEKAMRGRDIESTKWAQGFRDATGKFDLDAAVDDLEDNLSANYRKRSQYFYLTWDTHEKADIPIVLNAIADTYKSIKESQDAERFAQNLNLYNERIAQLNTQLETLSLEMGAFVQKKNITGDKVPIEIIQGLEDTSKRINETKGQLSIAQSRRDQTDQKLNGIMEPSSDDVRHADEDPVLIKLSSSGKDANIFAESMKQKFGQTHPEYRNAQRFAEAAAAEYASELKKILRRNLTADLKLYSDQAESYGKLLKDFEDDFDKQSVRMKDYQEAFLELEQKKDRQLRLQEQRSKLMDLTMDLSALKAREDAKAVTIAQYASTPREMSFPKSLKTMIPLGALLGLALTLGAAFLRELLDQRVRYTSDLIGLGARFLGMVPDVEDDPTGVKRAENAIREAPQSVVAESLRQTTSHILKHLRTGGHRSILFVGGLPGAGVTAILTNVAESIASSGKRVLVIDADFRRPSLAQALGQDPNQNGLGDVLAGKMTVSKAVTRFTDTIDLLASGTPESRIFERLATPTMDEVIHQAKQSYDVILIDSAPAIVAGDAMVLASKVDATVLVVRAFQEQRGLIARLCGQLNDMPSQLVGVVLNRPRNTAGGYFRKNYEVMAGYAKGS